jgi:hypothetical protein
VNCRHQHIVLVRGVVWQAVFLSYSRGGRSLYLPQFWILILQFFLRSMAYNNQNTMDNREYDFQGKTVQGRGGHQNSRLRAIMAYSWDCWDGSWSSFEYDADSLTI